MRKQRKSDLTELKQEIIFITSNAGKAEQLSKYLKRPVTHKDLELTEIQSLDPEEVTRHKVLEAYKITQAPVLIDDTSMTFGAFGKMPGPLIKYFLEEIGGDKICQMIASFEDQSATYTVVIGFYDGSNLKLFRSDIPGKVAQTPVQAKGFNAFFIPDGYDQPRAALDEKDFDITSARRIALEQFAEYIESL